MTKANKNLPATTKRAVFSQAFFRMESALTISATILLSFFAPAPFAWWSWWYWMVLGGLGESLILYTSIHDERATQYAISALLREQFNPRDIKTQKYRAQAERALTYRDGIEQVIQSVPAGVLRDHLYESMQAIAGWMTHVFTIARRLDEYERDELLHRERKELPASVRNLAQALKTESDPATRDQIKSTLVAKRKQHENLEALENRMEQAEFRLEETLTSLATAYSQFKLIHAKRMSNSNAKELVSSIQQQSERLEDIISSMNQVYGQSDK